jgi:hypothetical protein
MNTELQPSINLHLESYDHGTDGTNMLDFYSWEPTGNDEISFTNYKLSSDGTEAVLVINGMVANVKITSIEYIKSMQLKDLVQEFVMDLKSNPSSVIVEEGKMDNIDEEMLKEAEPAKLLSVVEKMHKLGYVEGAILVIGGGYDPVPEVSYGILADIWEDKEKKNMYIKCTDGRIVEAVDCQVANDVNKHILRMVEAEKGRLIEQAIKFGEKIDRNLEKIVFE